MANKSSGVLEGACKHPIRYIAVRGVREIARNSDLFKLIAQVSKLENSPAGISDVVIWDMGTPTFPTMSIVASTCRGWITIRVEGRKYMSENFGISFTPRETQVLKQFFEVWTLEGGQTVANAIKNIYEQTYVKDFKPGPNQIRLDKDEFKVFVNKLLEISTSSGGS